jgi:membrane protein DedA with SNARE-associated domain
MHALGLWHTAWMPDEPTTEDAVDESTGLPTRRTRLTDRQALILLIGYLVFRFAANRVGLAYLPRLLDSAPWAIPLLNNAMISLIATGTEAATGTIRTLVATGAASFAQSIITGLFLYWAGYRFGPLLAEKAAQPGSMWASLWNPKQIERASRWIDERGMYAIFIARGFVEWMLTPVLLVAGSVRMGFKKYLASFALGSVVYAGVMLWLGGRAGDQWPWLPDRIKAIGDWSFRITLILIVLAVIGVAVARPSKTAAPEADDPGRTPEDAAAPTDAPTDVRTDDAGAESQSEPSS